MAMRKARATIMKHKLIEKYNNLVQECEMFKNLQINYNTDLAFFDYCQSNIDRLDVEIDAIRIELEGGAVNDRQRNI